MTETAAGLLRRARPPTPSSYRPPPAPASSTSRIHLPGPPPRYAVCANGGHLLVDGVSDAGLARRGAARGWPPNAPRSRRSAPTCAATADPAWLLKERVAEDLFAYLVVERDLLPEGWAKELAVWAEQRGWTVSLQGRKLYAVPKPLTKSAAVAEVARRTGADHVLAAGDSLLDADLLLAADRGWRPGHGELADTGWSAPTDCRTVRSGVLRRGRRSCGSCIVPSAGIRAGAWSATEWRTGMTKERAPRSRMSPAPPPGRDGRREAHGPTRSSLHRSSLHRPHRSAPGHWWRLPRPPSTTTSRCPHARQGRRQMPRTPPSGG